MIIGVAGHVDHGKTALVKAITGVDPDRLMEEKARGITIDLGFAYWPQPGGGSIGFVDVPGHDGFVRNMLAGVTGVSALLLVVAANEGVKPQTLEHLLIADLLGLRLGVVAITKSDTGEKDAMARLADELRALLETTGLAGATILPVSAASGEGLDGLKQALSDLRAPAAHAQRLFRLPVDRAFTLAGAGTVVTGAVTAGSVGAGDRLLLSPACIEARVRSVREQNRQADGAVAGTRAAVNLPGVDVGSISRGDVLLDPRLHRPTSRLDAEVRLASGETKSLTAWTAAHLHAGAGSWQARLVPLSRDAIGAGETGIVQIVLDRPAAVLAGDRLILRDAAGRRTIGGGKVLDIAAPGRNRRKSERLAALDLLASKGPIEALPQLVALPPHAIDLDAFAADNGFSPGAFDDIIRRRNLLVLPGDGRRFLLEPAILLKLTRRIAEKLAEHHASFPDQPGLAVDRLRLSLPERLSAEAFAALAAHLERRGEIAFAGHWLRLPGHIPRLSAEHEALWAAIAPMLAGESRFKPPRVNELAEALGRREDTVRGLLKRLARRGDVLEVAGDHFLLRPAVAELVRIARETEAGMPERWFSAAAFRDRLGVGRRMAILILEFLDRQGVTVRRGDLRRVDGRKAGMFAG